MRANWDWKGFIQIIGFSGPPFVEGPSDFAVFQMKIKCKIVYNTIKADVKICRIHALSNFMLLVSFSTKSFRTARIIITRF